MRVKTGKVEYVEIKLEHVSDKTESKDKKHLLLEEYDIEVTYINGKLYNKNEKNKINYKAKRINKYIEKVETGIVKYIFSPNEHHFDIYEITEIINSDGKVEKIKSIKSSDVVERYD